MLHLKDIPSVYLTNIQRFWFDGFKAPIDRALSVITLIKWFIELIFFIPNIVIFPIVWTIIDVFSGNQSPVDSTDTSQDAPVMVAETLPETSLLEKNKIQSSHSISPMIWQVPHDDNPRDLGSHLFDTIHAINGSGYDGGYRDFNLALKAICERYLIIYTEGHFSFASKDHESISVPALQVAMKNLLILGKKTLKTLPPTEPYRFTYTLDIYKYLVRPFCRAALNYLNEKGLDGDTVYSIAKIQRQYRDWLFPTMYGFNRPNYNETQAAILIQRGYRKYQYTKKLATQGGTVLSKEYSQDEIEHYKKYSIQLDQPVPQEQKTIDKKALEKWVTSHTEDMQSAARSFSKLITHRSWFKTEKRLHYCINGFNEAIMSYPATAREYVIVVPYNAHRKSNHFMTSIAMKYLVDKPSNIIFFHEIDGFLQKNPKIQHLLFIDDASYSGRQLKEFLDKNRTQLTSGHIVTHLAIPFISSDVCMDIKRFYPNTIVHQHESMLSMRTLGNLGFFSQNEYRRIADIAEGKPYSNRVSKRTLYFFDHTIADDVSTFPDVFKYGYTLDDSSKRNPFVNSTHFQYRD